MRFGVAISGNIFWLIGSFVLPDWRKRCGSFSSPPRCQLHWGSLSLFRLSKIFWFRFRKPDCRILNACNALFHLLVATALNTARRRQFWGCASYVGLKRHIRLHWQIIIHLIVGIKYAVVGLLGYATKLHPFGATIGREYNHRDGYMGDSHQLGSSQRCSSAAL